MQGHTWYLAGTTDWYIAPIGYSLSGFPTVIRKISIFWADMSSFILYLYLFDMMIINICLMLQRYIIIYTCANICINNFKDI